MTHNKRPDRLDKVKIPYGLGCSPRYKNCFRCPLKDCSSKASRVFDYDIPKNLYVTTYEHNLLLPRQGA